MSTTVQGPQDTTHLNYNNPEFYDSSLVTDKISLNQNSTIDITDISARTHELLSFDGEYINDAFGRHLLKVQHYQNQIIANDIPNLLDCIECIPDDYISDEFLTIGNGLTDIQQSNEKISYTSGIFEQEEMDSNWCNISPNAIISTTPIEDSEISYNPSTGLTKIVSDTSPFHINEKILARVSNEDQDGHEDNICYEGVIKLPSDISKSPLLTDETIFTEFHYDIIPDTSTKDVLVGTDPETGEPIFEQEIVEHVLLDSYITDSIEVQAFRESSTSPSLYLTIDTTQDNVQQILDIDGVFDNIQLTIQDNDIVIIGRSLQDENNGGPIGSKLGMSIIRISRTSLSSPFYVNQTIFTNHTYTSAHFNKFTEIPDKQELSTELKTIFCVALFNENDMTIRRYFINNVNDNYIIQNDNPVVEYLNESASNVKIVQYQNKEIKIYNTDGIIRIVESDITYVNAGEILYRASTTIHGVLNYSGFPNDTGFATSPTDFEVAIVESDSFDDSPDYVSWYLSVFRFNENDNTKKVILNSFYRDKFKYEAMNNNNVNLVYEYQDTTKAFYPTIFGDSTFHISTDKNKTSVYLRSNKHTIKADFTKSFDNLLELKNISENDSESSEIFYQNEYGQYEGEILISSHDIKKQKVVEVFRFPSNIQMNVWGSKHDSQNFEIPTDYDTTKNSCKLTGYKQINGTNKIIVEFNKFNTNSRFLKYDISFDQNELNILSKSNVQAFINLRKWKDNIFFDPTSTCIWNDPIIINL